MLIHVPRGTTCEKAMNNNFFEYWHNPRGQNDRNNSDPAQREYTDTVLNMLRDRRVSDVSEWMTALIEDSAVGQFHEPEARRESPSPEMFRWLSNMFFEFERVMSSFNQKVSGTDFIVSVVTPEWYKGPETTDPLRFYANVATRFYSLLFSGEAESLNVYIVPAELILGLSTGRVAESDYRPVLRISGLFTSDGYCWQIGNDTIGADQLPMLARALFSDLIRMAAGKLKLDGDAQYRAASSNPIAESTSVLDFRPQAVSTPAVDYGRERLPSKEFEDSLHSMAQNLDCELDRLAHVAGKAAQTGFLLRLSMCKRLVICLSELRGALHAAMDELREITDHEAAA